MAQSVKIAAENATGLGMREGTNMAKTSLTSVGSSADSPARSLRLSPATGHAAEILDGYDPYLGYDAAKFP